MTILRRLTGPVYRTGGTGSQNNALRITLGMGAPYPEAVLAQERYEQMTTRVIMLVVGLPVALAFGFATGFWLAAPALFLLSALVAHIPPIRRWRELRGTAIDIELAARMGAKRDAYEDSKAQARLSYPQFKGWTYARVKAAFVALRPWAARNASGWL